MSLIRWTERRETSRTKGMYLLSMCAYRVLSPGRVESGRSLLACACLHCWTITHAQWSLELSFETRNERFTSVKYGRGRQSEKTVSACVCQTGHVNVWSNESRGSSHIEVKNFVAPDEKFSTRSDTHTQLHTTKIHASFTEWKYGGHKSHTEREKWR